MARLSALLLCILFLVTASDVRAQNNWEVGLRFGDNVSIDATVPFGYAPRLHAAVYLDRFGVAGYGNWAFNLANAPKNLKFYIGAGPELFFETRFDFAVAGDLGAEWVFDQVPVTVGFDWRPALRLTNGSDFHTGNWGFIARFMLGRGTFTSAD